MNKTNENSSDVENRVKKVAVGKETANKMKNNRSPKAIDFNNFFFKINSEKVNKIIVKKNKKEKFKAKLYK